jgi:Flp pilus assembly protein TadG
MITSSHDATWSEIFGQFVRSARRISPKFQKDARGLATIEFALIVSFLSYAVLNVADTAIFMFDQLQVNYATQMGAQAAFATCDYNHLPATINCPGLSSAVTTAVHSTSLGAATSVQTGFPAEAYYCVNSSGALQAVGTLTSKPANCAAAGSSSTFPGDYVLVQTTYTYAPIFPGLTVASTFPTSITDSAWVRLG